MTVSILTGDCRDVLAGLEPDSFDSCVTDPPYHLTSIVKRFGSETAAPAKSNGATGVYARASAGFMGQTWDGGDVAFRPETWAAVFRVLKPGAHLVAFGGTRTYHRMVCAIEDAGFEIRDQIGWAYGSGFPKSLDVSKAIDKAAGAEREVIGSKFGLPGYRQGETGDNAVYGDGLANGDAKCSITAPATPEAAAWQGWGTALKPAWEPIVLARKPLVGTVAANVLAYGTGALNIDGCRVETTDDLNGGAYAAEGGRSVSPSLHAGSGMNVPGKTVGCEFVQPLGRWPANLMHDGSDEVLAGFPESAAGTQTKPKGSGGIWSGLSNDPCGPQYGDTGSAARFFYCAKADKTDRGEGNTHPTVKPGDLMRWLVRLITPPGGHVLDPFGGSGSTGLAASREQFRATLIELSPEYAEIARRRIADDLGPLFGTAAE
jgi:site-specific DNA-methyltransferase (adenine-specific)